MDSSSAPRDHSMRLRIALSVAATYFVAGKLGLMLAIPPGYASAIWPPSGIALGCLLLWGTRYWPAIWLGSVLTNLTTSFDGSTTDSMLRSLMMATSIGGGAALQAALGAKLLRRFVHAPEELIRERDIVRFFTLGGPVTHLFNATWGTCTLLIAGAIPVTALSQNWWTWWVGDTVGAMIFAPLVIMWGSDHPAWSSRRTVVSVPLLGTFCAAILLFYYTNHADWEHLQQRFTEDSNTLGDAIAQRIERDIDTLHSVDALWAARSNTDRSIDARTFSKFAAATLPRRPELRALEWAPQSESAAHRVRYPVRIVEPAVGNEAALGFDLASEPRRRQALELAATHGHVEATAPVDLIQQPQVRDGMLLVLPIYASADKRKSPSGFVVAVTSFAAIVHTALHNEPMAGKITLTVRDSADLQAAPLYRSHSRTQSVGGPTASELAYSREIPVGDRTWRISFAPTLDYLAVRQAPNAWIVLAGGMLFTALMGIGALLVTGRARSIEGLVAQRTVELAQINEKLADEICDHLSTEHALEKERELLNAVINNLYEGILVLDSDGQLQMANGVAYQMFQSVTGNAHTAFPTSRGFRMYACDGATELQLEQTPHYCALRGETVSDFEMVVQSPGRAPMTLVVNAQPLLTGDRQRHGAIVVMRDITDRKDVERMKAEFVATVSHELRTPITSIRGSLGLIAGGVAGPLADKTRNLVEIALRNSDRLAQLINDLLDIEKMESGKMHFEMTPQSLGVLIEQAIEANTGYAQNLNVELSICEPLPSLEVTVDPLRLVQVMSNLLSNAAKFSPPGSSVEVAVVATPSGARVHVTDKGPGIPEEFHSRIFHKFSQADSSDTRAKSGTGLGLAICKAIIEQMGGSIGYQTKVGAGTTFYFELPAVAAPPLIAAGTQ